MGEDESIMNYFKILWGYPSGAAEVGRLLGVLGISRDRLEIRLDGGNEPIILKDDQVVSIRTEGLALLRNQLIVIEHTAYNTIGTVAFHLLDGSIQQLLQQIHANGFRPSAQPGVEWNPAWGVPEENDRTPNKAFQAIGTKVPQPER